MRGTCDHPSAGRTVADTSSVTVPACPVTDNAPESELVAPMPRITEATVAAHRAAQLTRLMDAAHEIAEEGGAEAVTLASVAQRAGLARSSMYGYFASRDDLIVAVCEGAVVTWCDTIVRSMTAEADPERQLRSYVEAQLAAAADTRHESAMLLLRSGVSAEGLERIKAAHAPLRAALLDTLVRMRLAEPQRGRVRAGRGHRGLRADPERQHADRRHPRHVPVRRCRPARSRPRQLAREVVMWRRRARFSR